MSRPISFETTLTPWRPGLGMSAWDDAKNYLGPTLAGWFVYSRHRDSDLLSICNYDVMLEDLQEAAKAAGVPECVTEHDFGHWAVGWVRQIVIGAGAPEPVIRKAEELQAALADEELYSEREWEAAADLWDRQSPREKVQAAMDERSRCHWLATTPVWRFGRMDYADLGQDGSRIAEYLLERFLTYANE